MIFSADRLCLRQTAKLITPKVSGFTLIELMVVVTIIAVLLGLAAPSFRDATLGSKLSGYANSLVGSIRLARGEAIKRNAWVAVCISTNGTSCANAGTWEQGWIVFNDINKNGSVDSASGEKIILYQQALNSNFKVTEASSTKILTMKPMGVGTTNYTFKVCRASPIGKEERQVNVYITGRTSVSTTTTGLCS